MEFNLPKLKSTLSFMDPPEQTDDQKTFQVLQLTEPPKLSSVVTPSEQIYKNLINAELSEFVKQFKTIQYDSSEMIMSYGDKMLLIMVMDEYCYFDRPDVFNTFHTHLTVLIEHKERLPEEYIPLSELMARVYLWIGKVLRVTL